MFKIIRIIKKHGDRVLNFVATFSLLLNLSQPLLIVYAEELSTNEATVEEVVTEEEAIGEESASEEESSEEESTPEEEATVEEEPAAEEAVEEEEVVEEESAEEVVSDDPEDPAVEAIEEGAPSVEEAVTEEQTTEEQVTEEPIVTEEPVVETVEETEEDAEAVEKICVYPEDPISETTDDSWNIDGDKVETKEVVQLGVKYTFPQDENASLTFTCLPEKEEDRSKLAIKQLAIEDINLPDGVYAIGDYAYDLTTDMENGTFEYSLVLPKPADVEAKVNYIEQSEEEVTSHEVAAEDLKVVSDEDVEQKLEDNSVKVTELDHFTVFVVVAADDTYVDNSVSSEDNAWVSDNNYARFDDSGDYADYTFPDLGIPAGAIIEGIEVSVEGYTTGRDFDISVFNQSNTNPDGFTSSKLANLNGTETTIYVGGATELWSKTWNNTDFDSDFRVRVDATGGGGTAYLDQIKVKIYYTDLVASVPFSEGFGGSNSSTVIGWKETDPAEIYSGSGDDTPTDGKFAKLGEDGIICKTFDAYDDASLVLSYDWKGDRDAGSSDDGVVDYKLGSACGSSTGWTNLSTHELDEMSWQSEVVDLPSFLDNSTFSLRFRNNANHDDEYFRVDSIEINSASPALIVLHKLVCDDESDLPNWGAFPGGPAITEYTASDWVSKHEGCRLQEGWKFQWGYSEASNPGDNTGESADLAWTTTPETDSNGQVVVEITDLKNTKMLWVREVWEEGYVPFSFGIHKDNSVDYSAELYCHNDALNYDNYDWIDKPENGETYHCVGFNATATGSISGHKFNDQNANNQWDAGEPGLPNWEIKIDGTSVFTNSDGYYELKNLAPKTYDVEEINLPGWQQTKGEKPYHISVQSGKAETNVNFGNTKLSDLHGFKYLDENGNGRWDCEAENIEETPSFNALEVTDEQSPSCEAKLSGWTIFIDKNHNEELNDGEKSTITDTDGWYWFTGILPGEYQVCEVIQEGWYQTEPYMNTENHCHDVTLPYDSYTLMFATLNEVFAPEFNFGNVPVNPELRITKTNDAVGDLQSGDEVEYTLTLEALGGKVLGVNLVDLLPEDFVYVSGSWSASSSVNLAYSIPEPSYASPGTWNLGDMEEGEVVTLTYMAKIQNSADSGLYKDLAWAKGENILGDSVLAVATDPGFVDTNFVGTDVNIVNDVEPDQAEVDVEKTVTEVGEVLGASTFLPATGSDTSWLYAAFAALILGAVNILVGGLIMKRKINITKFGLGLKVFVVVVFGMFIFSSKAHAGSMPLPIVRIEEPAAVANGPFGITFVAQDLLDRDVTAQCYIQKPGEGSFTAFGSEFDLGNGGDSEICDVTNSQLTDEGSYKFKVAVTAHGDPDQTVDSDEVDVDYDGNGPERPRHITVNQTSSCKYEIEVKTHSSGETAYVEVYADDDLNIEVNDGSKIKTHNMGPDEEYDFDYEVYGPDCDEDWYFATRAFDSANNPSDVRAQEVEDINVVTTGETVDSGTTGTVGAIPVAGSTEGSILGEKTADADEGKVEGQVLGEGTTVEDEEALMGENKGLGGLLKNKYFWGVLVLLALVLLNVLRKKIKNQKA